MAITTRAFGTTQDGQNVTMYTLTNHSGASVSMLDLGAIVTNILVPDKNGKLAGDARRGGYGGFRQVPLRFRGYGGELPRQSDGGRDHLVG